MLTFTENNCRRFSPSSFKLIDKISILTWKLLAISSQKKLLWTMLLENLLLAKYHISVAAALVFSTISFCSKLEWAVYFCSKMCEFFNRAWAGDITLWCLDQILVKSLHWTQHVSPYHLRIVKEYQEKFYELYKVVIYKV